MIKDPPILTVRRNFPRPSDTVLRALRNTPSFFFVDCMNGRGSLDYRIKPLDEDAIVAAAEATGKVVTAEDHTVIGGLGGAVAEVLGEKRPTPMKRIGIRDTFGESADNDDLLAKYGLTSAHVADAARVLMG